MKDKCIRLKNIRKRLDIMIRKEFNNKNSGESKEAWKKLSESDVILAGIEKKIYKC